MYTGQIAQITNREDWVSDFYQFTDEDTGEVINIANPDIAFTASVYIMDQDQCHRTSIDIAGGQVFIAEADDGPGVQWIFRAAQLSCLCAGTYTCGMKTTANGFTEDILVGTIAVTEGLR